MTDARRENRDAIQEATRMPAKEIPNSLQALAKGHQAKAGGAGRVQSVQGLATGFSKFIKPKNESSLH